MTEHAKSPNDLYKSANIDWNVIISHIGIVSSEFDSYTLQPDRDGIVKGVFKCVPKFHIHSSVAW